MDFLKNLIGDCKNCVEFKRENDLLKESCVEFKHENDLLKESCVEFKHENDLLKEKVRELESALAKLEVGEKRPSKRPAAPIQPLVVAKSPRTDEKRQYYAAKNDLFDDAKGYCQIQGTSNQVNVDCLVKNRKLRVQGSRGRSCLCCSIMFHLTLICCTDKRIERFNAEHIDKITMRGLHLDYTARQLAESRGRVPENFLQVADLEVFEGRLTYDDKRVAFSVQDIMEGRVHDPTQMVADLESLVQRHMLIVLKEYWFGVYRRGINWFIYNCHASPEGPGVEITGNESASIVRAESAAEVCKILVHFANAGQGFKGWYTVHELEVTL